MNGLVVRSCLIGAAGAVAAIAAVVQHNYGVSSIALFAVAAGACGAHLLRRSQDAANDRAVLHCYENGPGIPSTPWRTNLGFAAPQSSSASTVWLVPASTLRPPIPLNDG
ncbi:hypothetical protein AB0O07_08365 [Streptomyces sp. NPDC093085]|uniref:hypothetical protein n=1 Tax=Streptomyces sp. NPDC093085 TaxID=3155068 RepID=UPI0034142E56